MALPNRQPKPMVRATTVSEIPNAFNPSPLNGEDLNTFYCDTIKIRTGNDFDSPLDSIYEAYTQNDSTQPFLFMGHRGCGKSTELNKLHARLRNECYTVVNINAKDSFDVSNVSYEDFFLLITESLLDLAKAKRCSIPRRIADNLRSFWCTTHENEIISERLLEIGTPDESAMDTIISSFVNIKADIKYNRTQRDIYRKKLSSNPSQWIENLNELADTIAAYSDYRLPIFIFEDLDKLPNPDLIWEIFLDHGNLLTSLSFPIIYTFPIALSYSPKFGGLTSYFSQEQEIMMPMIKLQRPDGTPYDEGREAIRKIVEKRADLSLFDEDVLDTAITKTGGSLRELFEIINTSANYARCMKSETIRMEYLNVALNNLKSNLTRRITSRHYAFLAGMYADVNQRREIRENYEGDILLLETLQAGVALEYNSERWHNVHPLVADFLIDIGELTSDGKLPEKPSKE